MGDHGGSMITMGVVVVVLFAVETAFGVVPPFPDSTAAFRRLVESPTFWAAFVGNVVVAIAVAAVVTGGSEEDREIPPDRDGR